MNKEKIKSYSILSLGALSFAVLFFLFVKFAFPILLPFLVAWAIALATSGSASRLSARIHAPRGVIRLVMSILLLLFVLHRFLYLIFLLQF